MHVVKAPDPKLRVQTKEVKVITPNIKKTIDEMVRLTKTFVDPEGVGLASTQVGLDGQFFVSKMDDESFKAFFNPRILKFSKKTKLMLEGCLSIPNFWGEVNRHVWVDGEYTDIDGNRVQERMTGLMAHIFQHEVDHLNGKLFMDHILEQKTKLYKVVGRDRAGSEIFEEVAL
jgi:peptide deformylase